MKFFKGLLIFIGFTLCFSSRAVSVNRQKYVEKDSIVSGFICKKKGIIKTQKFDSNHAEKEETGGVIAPKEDLSKNKYISDVNQLLLDNNFLVHESWNLLLQKHVTNKGVVNYKSFKTEHKELRAYLQALNLFFKKSGFQKLSKEERLAFWINAYNAMTVDLILRNYPVKSIKDIKSPWKQRRWRMDDKWYNLDEIEHQILRKIEEPRIHFAIVCASYSCPKLLNKAYTALTIEDQLTHATKSFLKDSQMNTISKEALELSKIFQWFAKDFKKNGTLIDFLNRYSEIKISKKAKITYKDYNWALNE